MFCIWRILLEQIYTIPVNEAFEAASSENACECPFCTLYNRLENDELELILGASMMEPDVRIKTNKEGFCKTHYDMMFTRKNRLGMALTLESHLDELSDDIFSSGILSPSKPKSIPRISELEKSCYVCKRIDFNFTNMIRTAVLLWDNDPAFREKLSGVRFFCLPHYREFIESAQDRLPKKVFSQLNKVCEQNEKKYMDELKNDVSWFCKKFDYRYDEEPWYNSKDAVERAMKFLRGDLHAKNPKDTKLKDTK